MIRLAWLLPLAITIVSACASRGPKTLHDKGTGITVSKPKDWVQLPTATDRSKAPLFLIAKYQEPVPQFNPSSSVVWMELPAPVTKDPEWILSRLESQVAPTLKSYKRLSLGIVGAPPQSVLDPWRARLEGQFVFENPSGRPSEDAFYKLEVQRNLRGLAVLSSSGPLTGLDSAREEFDEVARSLRLEPVVLNVFESESLKLDEKILSEPRLAPRLKTLSPQQMGAYLRHVAARGFWRMEDENLVYLNALRARVLDLMSDSECSAFATGSLSETHFGKIFVRAANATELARHFELNWKAVQLGVESEAIAAPEPRELLGALRRLAEVVPSEDRKQLMTLFDPRSEADERGKKGCFLLRSLAKHGSLLLSSDIALLIRSFLHPEALQAAP